MMFFVVLVFAVFVFAVLAIYVLCVKFSDDIGHHSLAHRVAVAVRCAGVVLVHVRMVARAYVVAHRCHRQHVARVDR